MKRNAFLLILGLAWACASVKSPEGGPRDKKRPVLKAASPEQGETSFYKKSIVLEFDEEIEENNFKKAFLSPIISITTNDLGKKIELRPDSGWKPNTTYVLQLRNKIKDKTEGNSGPDTALIFSTGTTLDKEKMTFRLKTLSGTNYEAPATILMKDSSNRIFQVVTDSLGKGTLQGLKKGRYQVESFLDKNENYSFEEDEKVFFESRMEVPDSVEKEIYLLPNAFKPVKIFKQRKGDTIVLEASSYIRPDPIWEKIRVGSNKTKTLFRLYPVKNTFIHNYADSLGNCYTDTLNPATTDSMRSLPVFDFEKKYSLVPNGKIWTVNLETNYAILSQPDSILMTQDSVWYKAMFQANSFGLSVPVQNMKPGWIKLQYFGLTFFDSTSLFKDSVQVSKSDLYTPGLITGKIETRETSPLVLELIDTKTKKVQQSFGNTFKFLTHPGSYRLQIFADKDKDGHYTGGNKEARRIAEPLYIHPQTIELKPGWDLENISIKTWF